MTARTAFLDGALPAIARIAGLPAEAIASGGRAAATARALAGAEAARHAEAGALADRIHALVPEAEPSERRFLLALRRDCHNGRPLARHADAPGWAALAAAVPEAGRALAADRAAATLREALRVAYAAERSEERARLRTLAAGAEIRRGLALSTPDLSRAAERLPPLEEAPGRAARKAEANLLRYLSRAAVKVSPFSTFTRVGVAALRSDLPADAPPRVETELGERSLVRVRPYLLDRCVALLRRHPPVRDRFPVVRNGSATELEPGRFLYLAPSHWKLDAEGRFSYVGESLVRVGLAGPVVDALRDGVADDRPTWNALVGRLEARIGAGREALTRELDALERIGFVVLLSPWPTQEGHTEREMVAWLRTLPPEAGAGEVREGMERLLHLEEGFAGSADPLAAALEMDRLCDGIWEAAARLVGVDPSARRGRSSRYSVYEDVYVAAAGAEEGSPSAVVQLPLAPAARTLEAVEPLLRATSLFDHRHDLLHALEAFAADRWPGRDEVGALELFHSARQLWSDHVRFRLATREPGGWRRSWNPLGLPAVEALARHREAVAAALPGCGVREGGEQRIPEEALERLLDGVPEAYTTPELGAALFVQPADAAGRLWVLNRVKEGTGRFGSRFTTLMDPATRAAYTAHMTERGTLRREGETVRLLDLRCVQGDTLNVHDAQTPRVLALPGMEGEIPPGRRVTLGELRVRFGAGRPHLRGAEGERLLAVQLGFAYEDYLPTVVKFLATFGPSELRAVFPTQWVEREGEVSLGRRTRLGDLVIHRAWWDLPVAPLRETVEGRSGWEAFAAVDRWRRAHALPERVFLTERVPHPQLGERVQPQYVDFASPAFVELLLSALAGTGERLQLVEALPDPADPPRDGAGRGWMMELLVDSLALCAPHRPITPPARRPRRVGVSAPLSRAGAPVRHPDDGGFLTGPLARNPWRIA